MKPSRPIAFPSTQAWSQVYPDRECGPCYACCIYLGIEELRKPAAMSCKHLDGSHGPNTRCSIYKDRPLACSQYKCLWREGISPPNLRPHECGFIMTSYAREDGPGLAITIIVFDAAKAEAHNLTHIATQLLLIPNFNEVRIISYETRKAILFVDGYIYNCKLLPITTIESLNFEADEVPIGKYMLQQS